MPGSLNEGFSWSPDQQKLYDEVCQKLNKHKFEKLNNRVINIIDTKDINDITSTDIISRKISEEILKEQ